jgi:hypothetical protein
VDRGTYASKLTLAGDRQATIEKDRGLTKGHSISVKQNLVSAQLLDATDDAVAVERSMTAGRLEHKVQVLCNGSSFELDTWVAWHGHSVTRNMSDVYVHGRWFSGKAVGRTTGPGASEIDRQRAVARRVRACAASSARFSATTTGCKRGRGKRTPTRIGRQQHSLKTRRSPRRSQGDTDHAWGIPLTPRRRLSTGVWQRARQGRGVSSRREALPSILQERRAWDISMCSAPLSMRTSIRHRPPRPRGNGSRLRAAGDGRPVCRSVADPSLRDKPSPSAERASTGTPSCRRARSKIRRRVSFVSQRGRLRVRRVFT